MFNWFKKKKKKEVKETQTETKTNTESKLPICQFCHEDIENWEKRKAFDKKKYHIKCFRKLKKVALHNVLG